MRASQRNDLSSCMEFIGLVRYEGITKDDSLLFRRI